MGAERMSGNGAAGERRAPGRGSRFGRRIEPRFGSTRGSRRTLALGAAALAAALGGACGSSDEPGGGDGPVPESMNGSGDGPPRVARVRLRSSARSAVKAIEASFFELDAALDAETLDALERFSGPAPGDCAVRSEDPLPALSPRPLDVGEALVLTGEAGTYATVERTGADDEPRYEATLRLDGPFPDPLRLSVPAGTGFAASDVVLPIAAVEPATIEPAVGERVSADTLYRWRRGAGLAADEALYIELWINVTDVIDNEVLCVLPSGTDEFTLPREVLDVLEARGEAGFDGSIGSLRAFGSIAAERAGTDGATLLMRHRHRLD